MKPDLIERPVDDVALRTAQIGKAGELLVQYHLLLEGIESSHMSTDAGVDLVAYSPRSKHARTIQVKTNRKPKPSGGKGKPTLDWHIPKVSPAELVALVELSQQKIWLFTHAEALTWAQQHPVARPDVHLYMHLETVRKRSNHERIHIDQFDEFRLHRRLSLLHGPF